jgi:hypothetical protein
MQQPKDDTPVLVPRISAMASHVEAKRISPKLSLELKVPNSATRRLTTLFAVASSNSKIFTYRGYFLDMHFKVL